MSSDFAVNLAVFEVFIVFVVVLHLGLVRSCEGLILGGLVRGLLYHGRETLASYWFVQPLKRPGEAMFLLPMSPGIYQYYRGNLFTR